MSNAVVITQEMFTNIEYDKSAGKEMSNQQSEAQQQVSALIVFAKSDINAALYHLMQSIKNPFSSSTAPIASVFVQESIKADFTQKLQNELNSLAEQVKQLESNADFQKAVETAKSLNAKTLTNNKGPLVVCDFSYEQFGFKYNGIVTLHTFRTAKEAMALVNKETLSFTNISIWNENHSYAYEFVAALKSQNFFINCHGVSFAALEASLNGTKSGVLMDKDYHRELLQYNGEPKFIVFPIGSVFAN